MNAVTPILEMLDSLLESPCDPVRVDRTLLSTLRDAIGDIPLWHISETGEITSDLPPFALTRKETKIYSILHANMDCIVPSAVLQRAAEIDRIETLWVHMYRIRKRIEPHHPDEKIVPIIGCGYMLTRITPTEEPA